MLLNMFYFRVENDAVFGGDCVNNFPFKASDLFRRGVAGGIDDDQRLVLIHLRSAVGGALEAALLYHPSRRDLDHVSNNIMRDLVVRAIVLSGRFDYPLKVLLAYDRVAEKASGTGR